MNMLKLFPLLAVTIHLVFTTHTGFAANVGESCSGDRCADGLACINLVCEAVEDDSRISDIQREPIENPPTAEPNLTSEGISYSSFTSFPGVGRVSSLCGLLDALWQLGIIVLITSVFGSIVYAGFKYVTAGVNINGISEAKQRFGSAVTGLILGLSSVVIIQVINPALLNQECLVSYVGNGRSAWEGVEFGGASSSQGEGGGSPASSGVITGDGDLSLLEVARANSVGKGPDGRCYFHVANYIDAAGFCGIGQDGFNAAIPGGYHAEARQFGEYLNQGSNAADLGIVRLDIDDPFQAPAGSIVVVTADRPGCEGPACHPTAGDIAVADGNGNFYNGGEMGYVQGAYPPGNPYVIGIYACQ